MKFKSILDEALDRGERFKKDLLSELFNSKTVHDLVSNAHFITAITRVIETKDEIAKVLYKQVKNIFDMMDVPTKAELRKLGVDIVKAEKALEQMGRKAIAIKVLQKSSGPKKKKSNPKKAAAKTSKSKPTKKKAARK